MRAVIHDIYKASKISLCIIQTRDWCYMELAHFLSQVENPEKNQRSAKLSNPLPLNTCYGRVSVLLAKIVNMLSWNKN